MFRLGGPTRNIRQGHGRINQREMAVPLWKIAQQPLGGETDIFTEQPQMVTVRQHFFKLILGQLLFPYPIQGLYHPEGADCKGRLGLSKIVIIAISVHEPIHAKFLIALLDRIDVHRILRIKEPILLGQQIR